MSNVVNAVESGGNFLSSDERELLAGEGAGRVMSAYVTQAAGRLALELGLADEVGQPFVDAFRILPTGNASDTLEAAVEIASAIDRLKETVTKYGGTAIRIAQQATDLDPAASVVNDDDEAAHDEARAPVAGEAASETHGPEEVSDAPQPLTLNKRSLAYVQSVFGDIRDLDLKEDDRLGIAQTLNALRGKSARRPLDDFTTQFQLLLAGLKDAEIGAHLQKKSGAVANNFSSALKRIKEQPSFSPEAARQELLARLARGDVHAVPVVESQPVIEAEEEADDEEYEEATPVAETRQFKETAQTGRLQGAIRLQLRKAGRDHMVDLGEARLKELIDQAFNDGVLPVAVQEAYMDYLATGVPEFGNVALKQCISMMPDAIATIIGEASTATVLPITTPTHHHRSAVAFSPANMPRKQPVLPFVPPRAKVEAIVPSPEQHEQREVLPLVEAAYREGAMSTEAWHKAAYTYITDEAAAKLELTQEQALGLWNAVHFGKGDTHKLRPPETKVALNALQAAMETTSDASWQHYPELQACLRKLVNPFPPQSLGAIQRSLRVNYADVSDGAAQRYVVAAISELLRDWRGEATA